MKVANVIVSVVLAAALLGALSAPRLGVYGAEQDKSRAEVFVEIAKKALETTLSLRDLAQSKGLDITRMNALIARGEALLKEAEGQLANNEFQKASEKAREAMKAFSDAIRSLGKAFDKEEEEQERGQGILEAISRARDRIEKIRASLPETEGASQKLVEAVNKVKGLLSEAEKLLGEAEAVIQSSPSNASEAAKKMAEANRKLAEAHRALEEALKHGDKKRLDHFTKGIEKELEKVKKLVEQRGEGNTEALKAKLAQIETLIEEAEKKAEAGDMKGAMQDIKEARDLLHSVVKDLAKSRGRR